MTKRTPYDIPQTTASQLREKLNETALKRILTALNNMVDEGKYPSVDIEPNVMSERVIAELRRLGYTCKEKGYKETEYYTISV
jgi:hypothetical protein